MRQPSCATARRQATAPQQQHGNPERQLRPVRQARADHDHGGHRRARRLARRAIAGADREAHARRLEQRQGLQATRKCWSAGAERQLAARQAQDRKTALGFGVEAPTGELRQPRLRVEVRQVCPSRARTAPVAARQIASAAAHRCARRLSRRCAAAGRRAGRHANRRSRRRLVGRVPPRSRGSRRQRAAREGGLRIDETARVHVHPSPGSEEIVRGDG